MDNHLNLHGAPAHSTMTPRTLGLILFLLVAIAYAWGLYLA